MLIHLFDYLGAVLSFTNTILYAKGNIWAYHLAVILICCLFALFIFLVCGFLIAVAIFILSLLLQRLLPSVNTQAWIDVFKTCLTFLGIVTGIVALAAILKNVKLKFKL